MWAWLAAHEGIAGALLGAVLGAILGFATAYALQVMQRCERRHIARMRIATDLRYWLNRAGWDISEAQTFIESDGAGGDAKSRLADFRFEAALEQVSLLDAKTANGVFQLIHSKDDVNASVDGTAEYVSDEEALDVFVVQASELVLESVKVYQAICLKIDWSTDTFPESYEARLRSEVMRLKEVRAKEAAASNEWLFPPTNTSA